MGTKPIPEIRQMLADQGLPSDLQTASKVRRAARSGALRWSDEKLITTDESRLSLKPENKP